MYLRPVSTLLSATAFLGVMTAGALSQEAQKAPSPGKPAVPTGWYKLCSTDPKSKAEICVMNFNVIGEKGNAVGQVRILEQKGAPQKGFTFAMPPGLLIQPGIRIQIDKAKTGTAKFQICTPQACLSDARFKADLITKLKNGNELKLIGINQASKQVEFPITLSGFTAAYDGDPIDPSQLAGAAGASANTGSNKLQQRLQQKADEARKRQLDKENTAE